MRRQIVGPYEAPDTLTLMTSNTQETEFLSTVQPKEVREWINSLLNRRINQTTSPVFAVFISFSVHERHKCCRFLNTRSFSKLFDQINHLIFALQSLSSSLFSLKMFCASIRSIWLNSKSELLIIAPAAELRVRIFPCLLYAFSQTVVHQSSYILYR